MAKTVIMPKFGFTQESAEIVRWLKQAGDAVEQGDPIVEVTTDKVNMEVEAPATGILDGLRFKEGDTVPVTQVIAFIREPNETLGGTPPASPAASTAAPAFETKTEIAPGQAVATATPVAARMAEAEGLDLSAVAGTGPGGRVTRKDVEDHLRTRSEPGVPGKVRAVPAARRVARETGVDLAEVQGTGPLGRIQSDDVIASTEARRAAQAPATYTSAPAPQPAPPTPGGLRVRERIPLVGMRATIATRMQKSAQDAPHITFDADVDVSAAEALRVRANERLKSQNKRISLTAVIVKVCAWALERHPFVNSRLESNQITLLEDVHLGVAVALEAGLIVPVVRDANKKSVTQIATEMADLAERARGNKLRPDDVTDGTFTISNLGMFGVDRFTAILNPPQSGILAVGRIVQRFVPDEAGQPVARPILSLRLSVDHRVVDGAVAARFLRDVREGLEHPELLIV